MIKPKKSLGQNFLNDKNILKKIVNSVNIKNRNVVEIGSGTGNLSKELLINQPKNLTLIEKDELLFKKLKDELKDQKNLKFINDDFLKIKLEDFLEEETVVFGNLPYNISTQILIKLMNIKWPPRYTMLVLMFQKEVADRILAKVNTRNYGRLRIITNLKLQILNSFNVKKNCFYPKPKVDSTILVLKPYVNEDYNISDIKNLEKITQIFFSKKRKMINKAFLEIFNDSNIHAKKLKINLKDRPNQLRENDYFKIVEYYEKLKQNNKIN